MTDLRATTPEHLGADPGVSTGAGRLRLILLAALLLLAVTALLTGSRPATYGELQGGLVEGGVTEVGIVGAIGPSGEGETTVQLTWHDGLTRRYAVVQQVVGPQEGQSWSSSSDATEVVHGDVEAELRSLVPSGGELTVTSSDYAAGWGGEIYGWQVANWVALAGMFLHLAIIVTLVSGAEPRRATRWAWFWLLWAGPLAVVAYVALGMPRTGAPTHPEGSRLTGGWALLLSLVLPKPWA